MSNKKLYYRVYTIIYKRKKLYKKPLGGPNLEVMDALNNE